MRPAGTVEHHTLFMIQAPLFMKGCEHFTFHVGSGTEVLLAGTRFEAKGYQTFGKVFQIDEDEKTIEITLNPPQQQYSAH